MFRKRPSSAKGTATQLVLHTEGAGTSSSNGAVSSKPEEPQPPEFDSEDLAEVLPIRKPKHLGEGMSSAAKLVAGGVVGGVASLAVLPAKGARERGLSGFAGGLAQGLVSAVALPTMGAVGGAVQVTRGAMQTPFSAGAAMQGKQWDKETRKWHYYSLPDEETEITAAEAEWAEKLKAKRAERKKEARASGVEDTSFYDLLGLTPDATPAEIKRAYLTTARRLHPDKNRDDPQANDKFQKVGEAYQVLSNEEARARYDAKGLDGLKDTQLMDSSTMYAMLFGSEQFEDLVGELQIAQMLQQVEGGNGPEDISLKHLSHKQRGREVGCAVKLAARLQPFVDYQMSQDDFDTEVRAQAKLLAESGLGELLTYTIGRVYVYKASQALRHNISDALKQKSHTFNTNAKALSSMLKMYKVSKEAQGLKEEEQEKAMRGSMATFLEGAWYVSVVDVESTLRHVCKKVLTDTSLSKDARKRRAKALKRMGELFLEAASADGKDGAGKAKTIKERLAAFLPPDAAAAAGPSAATSAAADDDDDDELHLGDDEPAGAAPPAGAAGAAAPYDRDTLMAMSVKELKAVMVALELSTDGLLEKAEFVDAICAHTAGG